LAETTNDLNKIISRWQIDALRESGYLIVKEKEIRSAIKYGNWLDDIINEGIEYLLQVQKHYPGGIGFFSLSDMIDEMDGLKTE
jgi:hypothetical protein